MKKMMIILVGALFMAMAPASSWGRNMTGNPQMRSITMNTGLPSNAVKSIVQDKNGFVWLATDYGLCRYDGYQVITYYNAAMQLNQEILALAVCDEGLLVGTPKGVFLFSFATEQFQKLDEKITSSVNHIVVDGEHNAWISTGTQGIFKFNLTSHYCHHYPMKASRGSVDCVLIDVNSQVWALSLKKGTSLFRLQKTADNFKPFALKGDATQLRGMAMLANADGSILVGTWKEGLFRVSNDGFAKLLIPPVPGNGMNFIHKLYGDSRYVLIGSDDGLVQYDRMTNQWRMLSEVENPVRRTAERFVYGIMRDREDGLWVGTYYGGVSYIPSSAMRNRFDMYFPTLGGLQGSVVSRFAEDARHRIWIATDDAGIDCYDPQTDSFVDFPGKQEMAKYNAHALFVDGDNLWVGTYGRGIIRMNMATGAQTPVRMDSYVLNSSCYYFFRDRKRRLWATSMLGAFLLDDQKQEFRRVKLFNGLTIDMEEDRQGNLWFATQESGLWCLRRNNTWKQYLYNEKDTSSLGSNQVNSIQTDGKGRLFVATHQGLCEYQPSSDSFRRIAVDAPSQDFMSILFAQGCMWLSSGKGIVKYSEDKPVQKFCRFDGLTSDQFLANSCLLSSDGRIYFGTTQGFNAFRPQQVTLNRIAPPVAITSLSLFNKRMEVGSDKLPEALDKVDEISLSHDENAVTFSFSALSYVSPEKNLYSYKLDGFDDEWTTTHEPRAAYTNLPAGSYTFRVKATNNDGVWSEDEATLQIVVHPPFWWSLPAKLIYLLLIGLLVWYQWKKLKLRHQQELDSLAEKKELELRDARLQFFAMVAREIRIPLTLILGPLDALKEKWQKVKEGLMEDDDSKKNRMNKDDMKNVDEIDGLIDVFSRNSQRMLTLVDQLLDGNKVEMMEAESSAESSAVSASASEPSFEPSSEPSSEPVPEAPMDNRPTILVVENDKDMRDYIVNSLSGKYRMLVADNGVQALRILSKHDELSLIITSWIMPVMNGVEFCQKVRQNKSICHLPIVILSAKTDEDSKAQSKICGADVFISKPFSMKYLVASVNQLIEMRRTLIFRFPKETAAGDSSKASSAASSAGLSAGLSSGPLAGLSSESVSFASSAESSAAEEENYSPERRFLVDLEKLIKDNLANPDLNVQFLADKLGMSRSSLFNKVKTLLAVTPNELIQAIRLSTAARLLQERKYRISEVSEMTGFSSSSYFAKCFQKQYGMKPAEYVNLL